MPKSQVKSFTIKCKGIKNGTQKIKITFDVFEKDTANVTELLEAFTSNFKIVSEYEYPNDNLPTVAKESL